MGFHKDGLSPPPGLLMTARDDEAADVCRLNPSARRLRSAWSRYHPGSPPQVARQKGTARWKWRAVCSCQRVSIAVCVLVSAIADLTRQLKHDVAGPLLQSACSPAC